MTGALGGTTRRVALAIVTLIVAIAGTAVFASAAKAGGVDTDNGTLDGAIYNATPYTWTLVSEVAPATCVSQFDSCFVGPPAATISPGSAPVWTIAPNVADFPVIGNLFSDQFGYDVYFVYKTQPASGPPEYLTITLSQCYCNGTYNGFKQSQPAHVAWITSSPPPSNYDPGPNPNAPPGPSVPNAEVQASVATPQAFDTTLSLVGDHTIDASTQQGQQLGDLLNQLCSGSSGTTCSFTQDGPTQYGPGTLTNTGLGFTCTLPPPSGGSGGSGGGGTGGQSAGPPGSADPPKVDNGFVSVGYTATESASLTVGGSITVGTKFNLFDTIAGKISITVQAQHEWTESKTLTRTAYVYIPNYSIGKIFVAPTVGKVTGTLVATTGASKYTITNFSETRSGVSNDGDTTKVADPTNPTNPNGLPQFEVLTDTYPMTQAQKSQLCPSGQPAGLGSAASRPAPNRLVPGRGVAKVQLGDTQGEVSRTLGRPRTRLFWPWPCRGLQRGCDAMPAAGGTWMYRGLSVRFAADRHVAGLIYRGDRLTARGLGVGSRLSLVRGTYPRASCTPLVHGKRFARYVYCTLAGHLGSAAVETEFRFQRPHDAPFECDRVAIVLVDPKAEGAA